jgi:flagellar biosynthesis/type III secretory pathway chaperone
MSGEGLNTLMLTASEKLADLERALDDEYIALNARDLERLGQITSSKESLLADIEERFQALSGFLGTASNADANPEALAEAQSLKHALKQRAEICSRKNSINGSIIELKRQYGQTLLQIIRGGAPGVTTYGPRAQVDESLGGNALDVV